MGRDQRTHIVQCHGRNGFQLLKLSQFNSCIAAATRQVAVEAAGWRLIPSNLTRLCVRAIALPMLRHLALPMLQQRGKVSVSFLVSDAARCGVVRCDTSLLSLLSPETGLEPLNAATKPWLGTIVWTDFRLAVTLFVVVPFALLGWSVYSCRPPSQTRSPTAEATLRCITSYWQASFLLLITVALNIQGNPLGVPTGLVAQAMILVSLWWWADLSDELRSAQPSALRSSFLTWRALASVAAGGGVLVQAPFQSCLAVPELAADANCAAWLEPPQFAADLIGLSPSPELGLLANGFCALYCCVLAYYAVAVLPVVGRRGRAPRLSLMNVGSPIGWWRILGFISEQDGE